MPVNLILNGYYRSGTTFLWKKLRNALSDHIVFYEPCHAGLGLAIREEAFEQRESRLHRGSLWEEYRELPPETLTRLLLNHPNKSPNGFGSLRAVFDYFDIYNALPHPVVLQTNRAHCFLGELANRYACKAVHLIRSPADVYHSIVAAYNKTGPTTPMLRMVRAAMRPLLMSRQFGIDHEFCWIAGTLGYPANFRNCMACRSRVAGFRKKFLVNWIVFNKYAIDGLNRADGMIVLYEELPRVAVEIARHLGVESLDLNDYSRRPNDSSSVRLWRSLWADAETLGLSENLLEIVEMAHRRGVEDYLFPED